ncbi:YwbE family protein [Candidatus Uhrbacteria bacterium]|nr:YwbE family protein [Candidatus Uhrbacteria bacterium]
MDHTVRKNIYPGLAVVIQEKQDQGTGRSTRGIVKDILTSIPVHPNGIKVRLETGEVGRVQYIEL